MLHARVHQALNFHSGAFRVLPFHTAVFLALIHSCRGQGRVISPSQPIVAAVGEDLILPCYLDPIRNTFDMTLEWVRPDLEPRFVALWRGGVELESKKHPSYKGRTSLIADELKRGNVSLNITRVKLSDAGTYRCFSPELNTYSVVELIVGAASLPVIQMSKNSSSVDLQCESEGWYPEPELVWLDGEGNLLPAGPPETVRGPDELYTVSSRVTVEKRHGDSFTCRVQQRNINQTRETRVQISGDFFADRSASSSTALNIIGSVVGVFVILAVCFAVWKWRQNKNRKNSDDGERPNHPERMSLIEIPAESDTANRLEDAQSQTDEEEHQRESNNAQSAASKGAELQFSVESSGQTDQTLLGKAQEETETQRDAPNPAGSHLNKRENETKPVSESTEQQREDEEEEEEQGENMKSTDAEAEVRSVTKEENHGEQLTAAREEQNGLNEKKEKLRHNLKRKEKEQKIFEGQLCKLDRQIKDKKEQIKKIKQELEDVATQKEECEKELQPVNEEDDEHKNPAEEDGKHEKMVYLEKMKNQLEEDLKKKEKKLVTMEKEKTNVTNKKVKATNEKEEVIKKLEEMEKKEELQEAGEAR